METIRLDEFLNYHFLSNLQLSPNAHKAAFVVSKSNEDRDGYAAGIWTVDLQTKACRPLTAGKDERSFLWMDDETILKLNLLLNTNLNGLPIQDINLGMIARLKEQAGIHSGLVATVLDAVAATIHVDEEDLEIYTSGATNIFKYPELSDKSKASELISTFEEKNQLIDLVKDRMSDTENTGIQVYIGDEMPIQTMKDCSVVTATYELGEGMHGTIGIIGPKRMDYENVVDNLKTLKVELDQVFKKKT